jgi:hypothetical protein
VLTFDATESAAFAEAVALQLAISTDRVNVLQTTDMIADRLVVEFEASADNGHQALVFEASISKLDVDELVSDLGSGVEATIYHCCNATR